MLSQPTPPTRNLYRDCPTGAILDESECWLWELAELDRDLERDPGSWDHAESTRAFVLAHIEDADAELGRRERLRDRRGAPPWPKSWPDRRAELERIKAALDLPRFVEEMFGARLERRGDRHVCRCPLPGHDDQTPSFTIYPGDRGWYCFGCGRGGSIFDLGAEVYGLSTRGRDFVELRRRLRDALSAWAPDAQDERHA